jgi:hypothetical protein
VNSTPPGADGTASSDPALSLFERRLHFAEGFRIAAAIWVGGQGAPTKCALEVVGRRVRRDAKNLPDRGRGGGGARRPGAGAGALSGADAPGCLTEEHPRPGARPARLDLDQRNGGGTSGLCQRLVSASRPARERVGLAKGFALGRCRPPGDPQESAAPRRRDGAGRGKQPSIAVLLIGADGWRGVILPAGQSPRRVAGPGKSVQQAGRRRFRQASIIFTRDLTDGPSIECE